MAGVFHDLASRTRSRYLVWRTSNVAAAAVPGTRTAYLERLHVLTDPVRVALWTLLLIGATKLTAMTRTYERIGSGSTRIIDWKQPAAVSPAPAPPTASPRLLRSFEIAGVAGIGFALYMLMAFIDARVWEGYSRTWSLFEIALLTFFGLGVIANARRLRRIQLMAC